MTPSPAVTGGANLPADAAGPRAGEAGRPWAGTDTPAPAAEGLSQAPAILPESGGPSTLPIDPATNDVDPAAPSLEAAARRSERLVPEPCAVELVIAHDPLLLLERAADAFLAPPRTTRDAPFPSPPYLLALRQGGLRDDLIRLAAERGLPGWLDPPLCTFQELPEWLGTGGREPCDDVERALILGGVLRQVSGGVFGRLRRPEAFIDALDRLFGDLIAEGVTPDGFARALEGRAGRDEFERQRDAELARIYREYLARLDHPVPGDSGSGGGSGGSGSRRDGRDRWLDCARAVAADPEGLAKRLGGRRELRLFGLQDLRGGWRTLLRALQASPALDRIAIYTAEPLDLGLDPPATVTRLDEPETIATRLFAPEPAPLEVEVDAIAAPDVERELEEVARRVRALAERGVPFHRIAVVARQARPYVDLALSALDRFGVPATARRRISLREVPAVRAVSALFAAAADGWRRHGLVELAEQPYFASELDARILNVVGYRRRVAGLAAWTRALDELATEAEAREARPDEEERERRASLPPAGRVRVAADRFHRFAGLAAELDRPRKLAEWIAWLRGFLAEDPWGIQRRIERVPRGRFDVVRVDLAGWRGLTRLVERWYRALDLWGGAEARIGAGEFHAQLRDLLDLDVALWTETLRGVQVLEGFAAAYRSFDHVFLVGLEAERFPLAAPASPIFGERERDQLRAAGLPFEPRAVWEARERELFRVLAAGARERLTVSWAAVDPAGRETVPSAFVEAVGEVARLRGAGEAERIPASRVVTPGARLFTGAGARERALAAAAIERGRAAATLSPYNGRIEDPALLARLAREFGDERVWSPSQLESFAKCPWAYFSARLLRIAKLEDPDEEMDQATRGALLHRALKRFYDRARERVGGPVFLRRADLEWAIPLALGSVDAVLDAARGGGREWLGHELLLPAKREELRRLIRRFVEWEAEQHEEMFDPRMKVPPKMVRTGVDQHEVGFDRVALERNGVVFRFRGSVDRVEVGVDDRFPSARLLAAVDYKTTKWSVPGGGDKEAWNDHVVLQVPLYAYALSRIRPGMEPARIEYRAIANREAVHSLQLYRYDKSEGLVADPDAKAMMERALDAVAEHVRRARGGEFPASPAPSCNCPPFCHALEICRIAGGPRVVRRGR